MKTDLSSAHPRAFSVIGLLIVLVSSVSAVPAICAFVGEEAWSEAIEASPAWLLAPFVALTALAGLVLIFTFLFASHFGPEGLVHTAAQTEAAVAGIEKQVQAVRKSQAVSEEDTHIFEGYLADIRSAIGRLPGAPKP